MSPPDRSRSFGAVADLYDRLRPEYPAAAIRAVLPPAARRAADVGAGTGKLTRGLLAAGVEVVAVEPDGAMREVLARSLPGVEVHDGVAESLPLRDGEVDAVVFGQSWHWVDVEPAAREAARVLCQDGVLGMLWNLDDDVSAPWLGDVVRLAGGGALVSAFPDPPALPGFGPSRRVGVPWQQQVTRADLVALAGTWSAVSTRPPQERARVLDEVRRRLDRAPEVAGDQVVVLPRVCMTWQYRKLPTPCEHRHVGPGGR